MEQTKQNIASVSNQNKNTKNINKNNEQLEKVEQVHNINPTQANEQQTPQKNYLQDKLKEYATTKNVDCLLYVAYVVVKKVCLKYAPNNTQTMQLYNDSRHPKTKSQDIQDLRQVALYGMLEQLKQQEQTPPQQIDYTSIFKNTFSYVNKYLYHLRGINLSCRPFDYSIEQLQDNGLDILVNIRKGVNQLVKDSNLANLNDYTNDNDTNDNNTNDKKQLVLKILEQLTPTQKQIAKLLALGLSQRQVAKKLNRDTKTIYEHITKIRQKANNIINNI